MIPWIELGRARIAGSGRDAGQEMILARRGDEFALRLSNGGELMNSRMHASEEALAEHTCSAFSSSSPHVLVGGLGMGFTLRRALDLVPPRARVTVVELVKEVVAWNRGELGEAAGRPLDDARVTVIEGDVAKVVARSANAFDAILMDVDNGPSALTAAKNRSLYGRDGLALFRKALRAGGVYGVWSAGEDPSFTGRLERAGFEVAVLRVAARKGGPKNHVLWTGRT